MSHNYFINMLSEFLLDVSHFVKMGCCSLDSHCNECGSRGRVYISRKNSKIHGNFDHCDKEILIIVTRKF